jgi:hypothetical protein
MLKPLSLFTCCLLSSSFGFSQTKYNIHFGSIGSVSGKFRIADKNGEDYNPFGAIGATMTVLVENEDPELLSLFIKLGLSYDDDDYIAKQGVKITMGQSNLVINPEILFPLSNRKLKLGTGIGFEYLLGKDLVVNGISGTDIDKAFYYGNMEYKQRSIVPFVNAELWFQYTPKVWLGCGIKQPLLNAYYSNENMDFNGIPFTLKHQPTYIYAAVHYQFY